MQVREGTAPIPPFFAPKIAGFSPRTLLILPPTPPSILRKALDKIAEIKSLLEERRIGTAPKRPEFTPKSAPKPPRILFSHFDPQTCSKLAQNPSKSAPKSPPQSRVNSDPKSFQIPPKTPQTPSPPPNPPKFPPDSRKFPSTQGKTPGSPHWSQIRAKIPQTSPKSAACCLKSPETHPKRAWVFPGHVPSPKYPQTSPKRTKNPLKATPPTSSPAPSGQDCPQTPPTPSHAPTRPRPLKPRPLTVAPPPHSGQDRRHLQRRGAPPEDDAARGADDAAAAVGHDAAPLDREARGQVSGGRGHEGTRPQQAPPPSGTPC